MASLMVTYSVFCDCQLIGAISVLEICAGANSPLVLADVLHDSEDSLAGFFSFSTVASGG